MQTADIAAFKPLLPPRGRLMALDVGEKTVGLALSDALRGFANPYDTLRRGKFAQDAQMLVKIIAEQEVCALVIGYPLNMDGSEGPRCQSTRQFARNLAQHAPLPTLLWDERMSTMAVTRLMLEADLSRARRAEVVDKMAASYILQGVLDALAR